ncbi:hypothetical protein [Pelagibius sp.]|uniref:pPIWI_RE_Z domain-containing protein n=1 Tax=Pelagibius sp. TaxID=1931238 RepID=UPI003BAE4978
MRSSDSFLEDYRDALAAVDPSSLDFDRERRRTLAQTELCLAFLWRHLPSESVRSVPALMMGYPKLIGDDPDASAITALTNIRHLCSRFGSMSAWIDALVQYSHTSEALRCFDVKNDSLEQRASAAQTLLSVIKSWLEERVPWTERRHQIAKPGEATVFLNRQQAKVGYTIPAVPADQQSVRGYDLKPRSTNPPIKVTLTELKRVADEVDEREAQADWPSDSLPPLQLCKRLSKIQAQDIGGFFDGEAFTFDGATHLVGMLSSGKSTLVTALLLTLTRGTARKRIAVLVSDTMYGAALAARLQRHGIGATVLSSLRNREGHLQSIHWQRSLHETGWNLSSLGDLAEGFSTACPLDGTQTDPDLIDGEIDDDWRYPRFPEKQCHRIYQDPPRDDNDKSASPDDVGDRANASSCPLWAICPAQSQQRDAVDASVLIMTPAAFVHMTPDIWTTKYRLSLPELLQYEYDLVIIDEVDGVQKSFDDSFAPRAPIMGDEQNTYAPSIGLRSSEALRLRSGSQFRKPVNAKWQSNFFTFFGLIGTIYAMLQNEREALQPFYRDTPFTAGSILYDLWRRRVTANTDQTSAISLDDPVFAQEFLDVIKVAGSINQYTQGASVSEDGRESQERPKFNDTRFGDAAEALQEIARQLLMTDFYEGIIADVEAELEGRLGVFNAATLPEQTGDLRPRHVALALVLATVTDLALSHYNWLVKTQAAVARDFQIEDGYLLGQASGLIRNYRTLLPANPAGAAFGLFYDEPHTEQASAMGGKLTLISHLGVGRHLLTHLHDLLQSEGQAGPHTLLLSGTSWAGGSVTTTDPRTGKPMECSSPSFDVQTPVKGVLLQPKAELEAIGHSSFALVSVRDPDGHQYRVSGAPQQRRTENLAAIAERLASPSDGRNQFERDWQRMEVRWAGWREDALDDRRRALLVTNSYADAAITADALANALRKNGYPDWSVHCLVRDRDDTATIEVGSGPKVARPLPRSLVERFGEQDECAVLVAPIQVIARGHNILNRHHVAAISSIYFLHRVHPRPDDLGPTIGRLNRFAQARFDHGVKTLDDQETVAHRAQRIRHAANHIVRYGLEAGRGGYMTLPAEYKAQFAWDMLTPLWQTIGRGIRGGRPVFAGFIDYAFAPLSFGNAGRLDTPNSSALVQCLVQLRLAVSERSNPSEFEVARLLYQPFYDALQNTEGLRYGE